MLTGIFAIVNVKTGRLWQNEIYSSYIDADEKLSVLDLQLPKLSELYDVFELSPHGWEIADNYQRDADICRILGTNYNKKSLAIA
jgi:hypothetical protein